MRASPLIKRKAVPGERLGYFSSQSKDYLLDRIVLLEMQAIGRDRGGDPLSPRKELVYPRGVGGAQPGIGHEAEGGLGGGEEHREVLLVLHQEEQGAQGRPQAARGGGIEGAEGGGRGMVAPIHPLEGDDVFPQPGASAEA